MSFANLCKEWEDQKIVGKLETSFVNESSGLAYSHQFKDRLYHVNDSGDGPYLYQTDLDGSHTFKIKIDGFTPRDTEDLAYGPCGGDQCIFIADVGDNNEVRSSVRVLLLKERNAFFESEKAHKVIEILYPDGPHNCEGVAVHPQTGDLYLVTKEQIWPSKALPAKIFKISKEQLETEEYHYSVTPTLLGEIDFDPIFPEQTRAGKVVTGFDFSADGKNALLLTYRNAVEIRSDLILSPKESSFLWIKDKDYKTVSLNNLPQQEAIAYDENGNFHFTSEFVSSMKNAPVIEKKCLPF